MKVLILGDGQGWIVDRHVDRMIEGIPECGFTKRYYTKISQNEFIELSKTHDLIHYNNWDFARHLNILDRLEAPILLSIRSHRYLPYVPDLAKKVDCVHVVSPMLQKEFPGSVLITFGVFEQFKPDHEFTVGMAVQNNKANKKYKGYYLVERACKELGVKFKPVMGGILPEEMPEYYRSLDLYVCASVGEGDSVPVLECMAMNVPVITTNVGLPTSMNIVKIERSIEGIKKGIEKFYTTKQILPRLSWENVNKQFYELYKKIVNSL